MGINYDKKLESISISFIRVFSMILIFLCHVVQESGSNLLKNTAQIFNVGVFVFLFISGYLYGQKDIVDTKQWYLKRAKRILLPLYTFMIIMFIMRIVFFNSGIEIKEYLIYLFNLQGFLGGVQGTQHLWFLSILMVCYIITPILNKFKMYIKKNSEAIIIVIVIIVCQLIMTYCASKFVGLQISYVLTYILGYLISLLWNRNIKFSKVIILDVITLISLVIRIISRSIFDNSILYDYVIVLYEQMIFGIAIFINIYYIFKQVNERVKIKENKIIKHIDKVSFYFYIVHYMYLIGPVRVMESTNSFLVNSIIAIFISYLSALILMKICDYISNLNIFKNI